MKHCMSDLWIRLTASLLVMLMCTTFFSCSTGGVPDDGSRAPENSRVTVASDVASDVAATAESEKTDEEKAQTKDIGTRKNAAGIGDTVEYTFNSFVYGNAVLQLTLNSVIRGSEAWQVISNANMFNSEAPEGKEYVIAEFKVTNVRDLSGSDEAVEVNSAQFSFADSVFAKESQWNFVTLEGPLSAELYEGASTTGTVVLVSAADDACYAIFNDDVWFALGAAPEK